MKKFTVVLLVLFVTGSLFANGNTETKTLIGIAMPETHGWMKDGASLKAEAEKRGYRAEVQYGNADQALQNQHIQNFLTHGAKVLIVNCINDDVAPIIDNAGSKGVKVIAYDKLIQNTDGYDYYITFNNFKVGELQAQSIVAGLKLDTATAAVPRTITLFAGSPTDANAFFFFDGAMSILNPYIDKGVLRVIGPYPSTSADTAAFQRIATENWRADLAKTRMETLLNTDARSVTLDAILAPNDALARAILEACKADARYQSKQPVISGKEAEFDSAKLAEAAILLADQIFKGQDPDIHGAVLASGDLEAIGDTGPKVVKAYLLDPVLVTKN